jgi:hypothetical protein
MLQTTFTDMSKYRDLLQSPSPIHDYNKIVMCYSHGEKSFNVLDIYIVICFTVIGLHCTSIIDNLSFYFL